jgi:hypothetical protein
MKSLTPTVWNRRREVRNTAFISSMGYNQINQISVQISVVIQNGKFVWEHGDHPNLAEYVVALI